MIPPLSVLLPVRDGGAALDQAMDSLLGQTFRDFELVAVDDGSADGSGERLEAWARRDDRVRVLRQPPRGLVAALNEGLAACRAPLLARMDADDLCAPDRLAAQLVFLHEHPTVGVVGSLVAGQTLDGEPLARGMSRYLAWSNEVVAPEAIARERFIESPLVHPSVMVRRSLLVEHGGYRDGPFPEDYELWLRLLQRGVVLAKVPRVLMTWREHGARATRRDPRYASRRHRELKIEYLLAGPLAEPRPLIFWGAGIEGKPLLRALLAHGRVPVAVIDIDPRKIGQRLHGIRVVGKSELRALLETHPGALVLVAVGIPEARPGIRDDLVATGVAHECLFLR